MPTVDYSQSIIYKLCCKNPEITDIYIGSTTNFKCRKNQHKYRCSNEIAKQYNCYVYQFIREHGGWDNWDMIMVEQFSCNNKRECLAKERYYIETLKSTLNQCIPNRTIKEWEDANREHRRQQKKEFYKLNKDRIKQQKKEYYLNNKEAFIKRDREYKLRKKNKIF
jgi:hypothetical protein